MVSENVWTLAGSRVPWLIMLYLLTTDEVVCASWAWLLENTEVIWRAE